MISSFIDGPLWYFSLAVFVIGVAWKLLTIVMRKRPVDLSVPRDSGVSGAFSTLFRRFFSLGASGGVVRFHIVAGYLFHLGMFALLFWAAPHVQFFEEHLLGFGWTPLPHWAFIVASQAAFLGLILLWLHRLMDDVSSLISTKADHVATILTFVVMLTGCLALLGTFESLRLLHKFSVEVFLIYFPFSSLMHAFTFVPSRAFTGAWFGRRGISA